MAGGWKSAMAVVVMLAGPAAAVGQVSLNATLEPYLSRYDLPALAAAVVRDGRVVAAGAVGTRRVGTQTPVTINDRFHLGSDTKAMTALLAAMLVEEGKLRWDSTVAQIFPELSATMSPKLRGVTLTQLLSHTSGVPPDNQRMTDLLNQSAAQDGNLDELRYWLVRQWVPEPLAAEPGTTFAYANMNYVIAGAMIERVTGRTWDELISERVFTPLKLSTAGLGAQASLGRVDAPLGHAIVDGKTKAFLAGPNGDNPPILGPAGIANMSVLDFARWAGWNAGEGKRGPHLVQAGDAAQAAYASDLDAGEGGRAAGNAARRRLRARLGRAQCRVGAGATALSRRFERQERCARLGRAGARCRDGVDDEHWRHARRGGPARPRRRALPALHRRRSTAYRRADRNGERRYPDSRPKPSAQFLRRYTSRAWSLTRRRPRSPPPAR